MEKDGKGRKDGRGRKDRRGRMIEGGEGRYKMGSRLPKRLQFIAGSTPVHDQLWKDRG